jgi:hypothetical protein
VYQLSQNLSEFDTLMLFRDGHRKLSDFYQGYSATKGQNTFPLELVAAG